MSFVLREQACRLIEPRQVPFFAFGNRRGTPAGFTARVQAAVRSVELLCLLATADMKGRFCHDQQKVLDDIELFREMAKELDCLDKPYAFPDAATRLAYFRSQGERYADEPVFVERPFAPPTIACANSCARQPFVVNATRLSRQMRRRTLDLIADYGGQVRVVYFEVQREEILARNHGRDTTLANQKMLKMASRWEVPGHDEAHALEFHVQEPSPRRRPVHKPA